MTSIREHRARLGLSSEPPEGFGIPERSKQDGLAILRGLASMLALTALTFMGLAVVGFVLRLYWLVFLWGWGLVEW